MGGGGTSEFLLNVFPLLAFFAIMYFLLIRPQMRRAKEHREMVANVRRGDVVVTAGGIVGKVTKVEDNEATVEIAENVRVRIVKTTLADVRSKSEPVPANTNTPS
ncbi:preprotein translocase subunit YajC [Parvibaculum sp.]|uniref:preprotein translocase subunit YajC n=1 Tax=Parvibaculum sp. TaxID=2024848 RepID=UPI003918E75C